MARVATTPEIILAAARDRLVSRGVVNDGRAFVCDDPDDVIAEGLKDDRLTCVWWRDMNQDPQSVHTEPPTVVIPVVEGDLMITALVRTDLDQRARADYAMSDQSNGASVFIRRVTAALNNYELLNSAGNQILMCSLTFRRVTNRGKLKAPGAERWRRYDCMFDMMFRFDLSTPAIGRVLGYGSTALGYGTTALGVSL